MEDILTKNVQQIIGAGAGTILSVGFVVGLYLAYKLLNKWLDKRREARETEAEPKPENGGNGKGSATAKLIVLQEIQGCQQKHESRIQAMEDRITAKIDTVHKRFDDLLMEIAKGTK